MGCRNPNHYITDNAVCFENINNAAQEWIAGHMGWMFWITLGVIALCVWVANRGSYDHAPRQTDNIDYQLQQINNHLSQMRNNGN